jgi:hypothetical protein
VGTELVLSDWSSESEVEGVAETEGPSSKLLAMTAEVAVAPPSSPEAEGASSGLSVWRLKS